MLQIEIATNLNLLGMVCVSRYTISVTRFGEISSLWQNCKNVWVIFDMAYLVFGKHLYHLWQFFYLHLFVGNGQRLKNNLVN